MGRHRGRLIVVVAITGAVFVAELTGGLLSGSLALLADAGHVLTDSIGLVVALLAAVVAARPPTVARTYGLQRIEVLAALANGVLLVGIAVWIVVTAVHRWSEPPDLSPTLMLGVAILGAVANLVALLVLQGGHRESLNLRGVYLEVLGDLLGSVAVIIAAIVILTTGFTKADVIASAVIAAFIVPRAWSLIRDVADVLLEATPRNVDLGKVRDHILGLPGVIGVHDLHAWTITSGVPVLSAHVVVDDECIAKGRGGEVLDALAACLGGHFDIAHCTFQIEPAGHRAHEAVHHD